MSLSWSYVGGRDWLQGASQTGDIASDPHSLSTASQHQQLCKLKEHLTLMDKWAEYLIFSAEGQDGRRPGVPGSCGSHWVWQPPHPGYPVPVSSGLHLCPAKIKRFWPDGNPFFLLPFMTCCFRSLKFMSWLLFLSCVVFICLHLQVVGSKNRPRHCQPPLPVSPSPDKLVCFYLFLTKLSISKF